MFLDACFSLLLDHFSICNTRDPNVYSMYSCSSLSKLDEHWSCQTKLKCVRNPPFRFPSVRIFSSYRHCFALILVLLNSFMGHDFLEIGLGLAYMKVH